MGVACVGEQDEFCNGLNFVCIQNVCYTKKFVL